jgi:hypothetical protein
VHLKKEAEYNRIHAHLQQITTYTENSSLKFKDKSENKFTIHIFGFLIFSYNQKSSCLIVLPFHHSTQTLPRLRHLSYHGMSFSLPVDCSPGLVLSTIVSQLFPHHIHLQMCGHQEFASVPGTANNNLAPDTSSMQDVPRRFRYKFICHVNSFSYLPPKKHKTRFP